MNIERAGRYLGKLVEWDVGRTKNGFIQFIAHCCCSARLINDEYVKLATPFNIVAYLILTTSTGKNKHQVDSLSSALGWSGEKLADLRNGAWGEKEVSIVVEMSEYNGKLTPKVAWINSPQQKIKDSTETDVASMESEWTSLPDRVAATAF